MRYLTLPRVLAGLGLALVLVLAACDEPAANTFVPPSPTLAPATPTSGPDTSTAVPATATTAPPTAPVADTATVAAPTAIVVPTDTAAPPTADTSGPPTVTPVPPADTPAIPTDTAAPAATDMPVPAPTNTTAPAPTNAPAPSATLAPAGQPGTWQQLSVRATNLQTLVMGKAGTVYAGGDSLYRSTDQGGSWTTLPLNPANAVSEIAVAPSDPNVIYAGNGEGCASGVPGALYRSNDGGATWTPLTGGPYNLDINPTDPNHLLGMRCDGLYKSTNGGQAWTKLPGTGVSDRDGAILTRGVNDRTQIYAVYTSEGGSATIQRSTDDGRTWATLNTPDFYGPHDLAVDPTNARHLYFVGGSGFYATADGGAHWNRLSKGLEKTDATTGSYLQLSNLALDRVSPPPKGAPYTLYVGSYGTPDAAPAGLFRWNANDAWVPIAPAPNGQSIRTLLAVNDPANPALLAATEGGLFRMSLR